MTLPRAEGFVKLWKITPPIRTMLAALGGALGMTTAKDAAVSAPRAEGEAAPRSAAMNAGSYIEAFGGAGMAVVKGKHHVG